MQQIAEKAVADGAKRNMSLYQANNAALMAEDPKTGQILALVGSADYFNSAIGGNFDMPIQGLRQPGSSLKPFVYLQALEDGYPPNTVIFDVPTEFNPSCPAIPDYNTPSNSSSTLCFHPKDFTDFQGPVTFEQALPESINVAAVKVLYLVGLQNVLNKLKDFGITTLSNANQYGLSLVLGGGAVRMVDMLKAYSVLSQEGIQHTQTMVLEVDDPNGNVLEKYQDQANRVDDPKYIQWINQILSNPELRAPLYGPGGGITNFPGYDVALKTGTSNDYRDAWAFGYTPSLVVGVWAGNSDYSPMQRHGSSILAAVPIWSNFLKQVLPTYQPELFTSPAPLPPVDKPMLNGDYIARPSAGGVSYPQIHNILYYVDRSNPLGPSPQNPSDDPQFNNWEVGVLNWASQNIPNFSTYNQNVPAAAWGNTGQVGTININNVYPISGVFISAPLNIRANISSAADLTSVEIDLNGTTLKTIPVSGTSYQLDYLFSGTLNSQNLITIKATDSSGASNSVNIIVYH
jgi:membrane peptidoglycan carboxypeptidase